VIALQRILCPVDFSESSRSALGTAAALSEWYGASLLVLHVSVEVPAYEVVPMFGPTSAAPPVTLRHIDVERQRSELRRFVRTTVPDSVRTDFVLQQAVDARTEILNQALELRADLLVMGTHARPEVEHVILGSVTEHVMRRAPCPVLIVPPHAEPVPPQSSVVFKRIVCAVDFSPASQRAVDYALQLAQEGDARLTLLHAIEFPLALREVAFSTDVDVEQQHRAAEAEYLRRMRALVPAPARIYCTVRTEVSEGRPHREILRLAAAEDADLIVMGVQGRGAVNLMVFGSNTHAVIRSAPCSILIVPPHA
jgi:nucleotide-binding universal stress UspA family protein